MSEFGSHLSGRQEEACENPPAVYGDLKACFINTTLKTTPEVSHTETLMHQSMEIMKRNSIDVSLIRAVDYDIAFGIYPDMREQGADCDDWPDEIWPAVRDADILVLGTPIWLGEESSVCRVLIERLYAHSGQLNEKGQFIYYGKTGGCVVTGNEDGIKHVAMSLLYALQHIGFVVPPQADCGWIGEAGPGPSYGDDDAGFDNEFTQRNTTFMTWNLIHTARMLKDGGGMPAHGNVRAEWDAGCKFDAPNPGHR